MGRMRGKLNELWALVGAVTAAKERDRRTRTDANIEWAVADEDGLERIVQVSGSFYWETRFIDVRPDSQGTTARFGACDEYLESGPEGSKSNREGKRRGTKLQ